MNLGEIKAFMANSASIREASSSQSQVTSSFWQTSGDGVQGSRVTLSSNLSSTLHANSFIGAKVLQQSLNHSLSIEDAASKYAKAKSPEQSIFDFEEIAKNVLNFVGGALKNAKASGMEDDKLSNMFEQAVQGVLKGVDMARDDLDGFMNDDIDSGIKQAQNLIDQGIVKLRSQLLPGSVDSRVNELASQDVTSVLSMQKNQGELQIRTKEGDEVLLRFEDLKQFQYNQTQMHELIGKAEPQESQPTQVDPNVIEPTIDSVNSSNIEPQSVPVEVNGAGGGQKNEATLTTSEAEAENKEESSLTNSVISNEQKLQLDPTEPNHASRETETLEYQFYQSSSFSFSVRGELDSDELDSIGSLVKETASLAEEFFGGDVDLAFQSALQLGFDDQELVGFALNLTRHEETQVSRTYEQVANFSDSDKSGSPSTDKSVERVSAYLDRMLQVAEQAQERLANGSEFDSIVHELINKMQDVHLPDLITALNRFNGFNKTLLENLPFEGGGVK